MARYRDDLDDERDYYEREQRLRRENLGAYDEPFKARRHFDTERRPDYNRGRFGERAEHNYDEPRYADRERYRDDRGSSLFDVRGDLGTGRSRDYYEAERSRLRCRDIMTRDLAVATRDTTLTEVARMMKQEDTGVIPVVEYDAQSGDGRSEATERKYEGRNYTRGKLVGLITDRDIALRAVADDKDCASVRSEDIMSVDIHTARPNDRVVEVIRKMGDKQVRRIPVVNENGYLVGMISMADIAIETRQDRELASAIEDISKGSSFWNRVFG
ncbi:MAG TPA: CBS domain-containing protein [Pyrinomonadaceae bacterium]|nr:CBS domain-containing protein [Pyrinomonadaceae bacterium]